MQDLGECKDRLHDQIRKVYSPFKKAEGQQVYNDYVDVKRAIYSRNRAREGAVLKQVQADYDAHAPREDIQEQLRGSVEFSEHVFPVLGPVKHALVERSRILEAFFCDRFGLSRRAYSEVEDCQRPDNLRERRAPRTSRKRKIALEFLDDPENVPPETKSCKLRPPTCRP